MKRVAVCLSGQLRTWQYCVDNILHFFRDNEDYQFDFFIHTWTSSERRSKDDDFICRMVDHDHEELNQVQARYNTKGFMAEAPIPDDLDFIYKTRWTSLFYSMRKSILLKEQYEIDNGFKYDIVVKSRCDLIFNPQLKPFEPNNVDARTIYTTTIDHVPFEKYNRNVNDLFFYCDSSTMDVITHLCYTQAIANGTASTKLSPVNGIVKGLGPGAIIDYVSRQYNFQSSSLHSWNVQEAIVRETAIQYSPFLSDADYQSARNMHYDFYK